MGWAARADKTGRVERELRQILALFPDRSTYEQWLTAVTDRQRAHLEQFLPDRLKAQGTV